MKNISTTKLLIIILGIIDIILVFQKNYEGIGVTLPIFVLLFFLGSDD